MTSVLRGGWHEVRALAAGLAKPAPSELVDLAAAGDHVLADDLRSLVDLPGADVSAMDGWAVAGEGPWKIRPRIVNGLVPTDPLLSGEARGIGTGGVVPDGATAIVRREHGTVDGGALAWAPPHASHPSLRDVRPRGEEVRAGEVVLAAGTRLDPISIAVCASCGLDAVEVSRAPIVDVAVTGDEVVSRGVPAAGSVRDSISPLLSGMVRGAGATPGVLAVVADDVEQLVNHLESSTADVVVTTGGTAVGEADHVRTALARVGATVAVDRIAVRPGGPTLLAVLADGRFVACLPGNPLAAVVGFMAVVAPVLATMIGRRDVPGPREQLGVDLEAPGGATRIVPFTRVDGVAVPSGRDAPSMLRGLAASDGLLVVPPGGARAGDTLETVDPLWRTTV